MKYQQTTLEERKERVRDWDERRKRLSAQRRAALQRDIILTQARHLLNEKGHTSKITVQDIASASQMSVGGFYLYYPSIQSLWAILLKEDMSTLQTTEQSKALKRYIPVELWEVLR